VIDVKYFVTVILAALFILGAVNVMAVEEASYQVVKKDGPFEIRDYAPHLLAETFVEGEVDEVGSKAFRRLFSYISGENRSRAKIAMTAPVTQEAEGEKIAMTAPVSQQPSEGRWSVSFTMPASYSLETLPIPNDPQIIIREVAARRMAAIRYSGFWSKKGYNQHKLELEGWLRQEGLSPAGDAIWARYDPPFKPWFMRRNEILIPLEGGTGIDP